MVEQYEVMHDPAVIGGLQNCNIKGNIGKVAAAFQQAMKTPGNGTNDEGEALKHNVLVRLQCHVGGEFTAMPMLSR